MNFFKLYIGDYQRDTAHLSVTEHGAFLLMLQHYYATEKPLPIGKALHRMLRAQDKAEREAIDSVASQFWKTTEEGLINERADREITKAATQAETNRAIAIDRENKRKAQRIEHDSCSDRATNDQPNQTPDTSLSLKTQRGAAKRGSRLPQGWDPGEEGRAFASEHGFSNGRLSSEIDRFRDYWAAATGQSATKADWLAAWRNWVRKSSDFSRNTGKKPDEFDPFSGAH